MDFRNNGDAIFIEVITNGKFLVFIIFFIS